MSNGVRCLPALRMRFGFVAAMISLCGVAIAQMLALPGTPHQFADRCSSSAIEQRSRLVCDEAGLLSSAARSRIATRLAALEASPLHECGDRLVGYQFGVATVDRLPEGEDIKAFSEQVFNRWGVGNVPCNDGVLLILSRLDQKMFLKTGRGARSVLTDGHAADILVSIKPHLREGDYDVALEMAVSRVIEEALEPGRPIYYYGYISDEVYGTIFVGILLLCMLYSWYSWGRRLSFERKLNTLQAARSTFAKGGNMKELQAFASPPQHTDTLRLRLLQEELVGTIEPRDCRTVYLTPDDPFWAAAVDNLMRTYSDVPGVTGMKRGAEAIRNGIDICKDYEVQRKLVLRTAGEGGGVDGGNGGDGGWGGGSCDASCVGEGNDASSHCSGCCLCR